MGDPDGAGTDGTPADIPEPVRRRLDDVFGDTLPDVTTDEGPEATDRPVERGDEWLRANRPPHHDDRA
jgi:hypothetical protein